MADFVYEIACTGDRTHEQTVHAWAERHAAPAWTALPGLTAVDLYQPVRGGTHDPFNNDGPGPLLMAILQFSTKEKLQAGLSDPRFGQSLAGMPVAATGTRFERRFFPVADASNPGPLRAPFSYVVRYHHPAQNVAEFVSHYIADHPPILGKLPAIRSVLCYLPVDAGASAAAPVAAPEPDTTLIAQAEDRRRETATVQHLTHLHRCLGRHRAHVREGRPDTQRARNAVGHDRQHCSVVRKRRQDDIGICSRFGR